MAPFVPKLKPLDMEINNFIERNGNKLTGIARSNGIGCKDAFQQMHVLLRENPELLKHDDEKTRRAIFWALRKYAFRPNDAMTGSISMEAIASKQGDSDLVVTFVATPTMAQCTTRTSLLRIIDIITSMVDKRNDGKRTMHRVLMEHIVNGVDKNCDIAKRLKITERTVRRDRKQAKEAARSVRNKILEILST